MAKEEKGFFDGLVDDFCRDLELKAAIEASRDENGKVDKWAALGGAMGLGHTSDDEIAALAGILRAEGAFDHDNGDTINNFDRLLSLDNDSEKFEDTLIGSNLIFADDMKLLSDAGYDELDLELMEPEELKETMESAGVNTILYDFD